MRIPRSPVSRPLALSCRLNEQKAKMITAEWPTTTAVKQHTARGVFRLRCVSRFVTVTSVASFIAAGRATLPGREDVCAEMTRGPKS